VTSYESSIAIVHWRPRGSQDASCSIPQGQSPSDASDGGVTCSAASWQSSFPRYRVAAESLDLVPLCNGREDVHAYDHGYNPRKGSTENADHVEPEPG
jgi:hypothetical protein